MKIIFLAAWLFLFGSFVNTSSPDAGEKILADGNQPQISIDDPGTVEIIYGQDDKIYYLESRDNGATFSKPTIVAEVAGMHLGMSRGPQLASSKRYSVITAMDKTGNIHWFRLDHRSGKWEKMGQVNDQPGSAPEGLMHIAADKNDHFYAVWLDIRTGRHNQIYFADLPAKAPQWSKNQLVYQSPDGHVCECCQPHISVNGNNVSVMFRNWLNGSRDFYLATSRNNGKSFSQAQKLGTGTWKLNACPMDGGGLIAGPASVQTTWLRQGTVYYCKAGESEIALGPGHESSITGTGSSAMIGYENKDTLRLVKAADRKAQIVGIGEFMKTASLPGNSTVCVWERGNKVVFKRMY